MRFIDHSLAKRLEMVSAVSAKECAQAMQTFAPQVAAATDDIAGGIAAFNGADSPVTQAFGVGLNGAVSEQEFDRLEQFFFSRGAPVTLELCPFIDPTLIVFLQHRPYRLEEFSNVLIRDIGAGEIFNRPASAVTVRLAEANEAKLFMRMVLDGFAGETPATQSLEGLVEGFFHRARGQCFFGLVNGEMAGAAAAATHDGLAELYGASTLPRFRNRGVQAALVAGRLDWAAQHGCEIATTTTGPGTSSQRNFERAGFQIVYSRTKMVRSLRTRGMETS